jgi:hypothetical protein
MSGTDDRHGPTSFGADPNTTYYVATFGLAKTAYADVPGSPGSQVPTGPEVTLFVGDYPMPSTRGGTIAGNGIAARPSVAGVTGYVTTGADKGTPTRTCTSPAARSPWRSTASAASRPPSSSPWATPSPGSADHCRRC